MPKLGSKKSRGGCTNCKRRRVKCDELKPGCSNCAKYKMSCVYLTGSSIGSQQHENEYASASGGHQQRSRKRNAAHHQANGVGSGTRHQSSNSLNVLADAVSSVEASGHVPQDANIFSAFGNPQTPFTFTLLDLSLLHHFTTETYSSVARPNTNDVWRAQVPKLAYSRDWLMRGIIAVAAMHLSSSPSTEPDRVSELVQIALTSMNAGLPNLNHLVSSISLDDADSCSAVAAYSALVAMYALSMPSVQYWTSVRLGAQNPDEPLEDPVAQILTTFDLVRGTAEIYRKVWHQLQTGPIAAVTHVDLFGDRVVVSPDRQEILERTAEAFESLAASAKGDSEFQRNLMGKIHKLGEAIKEVGNEVPEEGCWLAYVHLFLVVKKVLEPGDDINRSLVLAWPAILLPDFMRMLREHRPPALALLAVWALILKESSWLTKGWKHWIVDALWNMRESRRTKGEDVDGGVWWETVEWAKDEMRANPMLLEDEKKDSDWP